MPTNVQEKPAINGPDIVSVGKAPFPELKSESAFLPGVKTSSDRKFKSRSTGGIKHQVKPTFERIQADGKTTGYLYKSKIVLRPALDICITQVKYCGLPVTLEHDGKSMVINFGDKIDDCLKRWVESESAAKIAWVNSPDGKADAERVRLNQMKMDTLVSSLGHSAEKHDTLMSWLKDFCFLHGQVPRPNYPPKTIMHGMAVQAKFRGQKFRLPEKRIPAAELKDKTYLVAYLATEVLVSISHSESLQFVNDYLVRYEQLRPRQ